MSLRKRPGQSLIEVTMATMIAAITTTAVFSVVLSSYVSDSRADKRDAAAMLIRQAQETLKNYVSVEPGNSTYVPTGPMRGVGRWDADTSGVWALRSGNHDISSLLTNTPLAGGTFSYRVINSNCGFGNSEELSCKEVRFQLNYTD